MTTKLQEHEFPYACNKARKIALFKAGGIPIMLKLFAVTGQNNRKNAGKRAVDTEILLREAQSKDRKSICYTEAVARMIYLHARYRKAGKILDEDLLHTLESGIVESFRIMDNEEWRKLLDVEKYAIGIFHKNLVKDMDIPYTPLPSSRAGWEDGLHFVLELRDWTIQYEEVVAKPMATNDQYSLMAFGIDQKHSKVLHHLSLPRTSFLAVKAVDEDPNPVSGLYNFSLTGFRPLYIKPTFWTKLGPLALLVKVVGGRSPGTSGNKYHPQRYDLKNIGPKPQEGKGFEEMRATVEYFRARDSSECPFSHGMKS
ncbi:hypothetical protein K469DRAFT_686486 [Zopfia rhizophila CBS 207.26]|uniref:Uncharacterized protein n=1 Tax=Zopfia rhizophila CBS 207.26 TaxID=1314779 RepID=A0A6A6ETX3_9PEZI|nr:hypothetical protein K469DRAFT_686486 [Zopfia rhizophila CBS 207.26]